MPIEITMPALSPTMEEGTLAAWLVAEGDEIRAGDVIAEIETDKATMEIEAADEGRLARIVVAAGAENVAVNTVIAMLTADGEDVGSINVANPEPEVEPEPASAPVSPEPQATEMLDGATARIFASPLARRIAAENGMDVSQISGSGPKGRVVRADVETALVEPAQVTTAAAVSAPVQNVEAGPYAEGSYDVIELDAMRRTIATRLTEAKRTVPHFYLRIDLELDVLLDLRRQLNEAAPMRDEAPAYKISVNDLVIKALAKALADVPAANVTWADGKILRHKGVDVSVAVAIDGGLITPIIRDAQLKSVSAISAEMKDLAARARARRLNPEEFQGGTTSVSNLGMFGVSSFDAVINPPHGTILAVGAGERRPVVRRDAVEVATVMTVTLSVDHRMVDGAIGAELLAAFKSYIEAPFTLLS